MTAEVVHLDPIAHARAVKARLWNPPASRQSSELDIVSGTALRKQRQFVVDQQSSQEAEAKRAEADFRRQSALDDLMRRVLTEHTRAKTIAARIFLEEQIQPPKIIAILEVVSRRYNVSILDIRSQRRNARFVLPRMVVAYLARHLTFMSYPEIGRRLGNRDHTTILSAVRKIKARMQSDPDFAREVTALKNHFAAAN